MNILIINFLITLKNATSCKKESIKVSYNKHFKPFLLFFYNEGLIQSFKIDENLSSEQSYHTKEISGLGMDQLNHSLVSSSLDGTIKLWDFYTQKL